jgi:hypothetical protein
MNVLKRGSVREGYIYSLNPPKTAIEKRAVRVETYLIKGASCPLKGDTVLYRDLPPLDVMHISTGSERLVGYTYQVICGNHMRNIYPINSIYDVLRIIVPLRGSYHI